jgi:hypothetical protein
MDNVLKKDTWREQAPVKSSRFGYWLQQATISYTSSTGCVLRHIHGLGAKDTAVVVHLENTLVAYRAMVCSWWLWCYTFFTYAGSFGNEGTLKKTRIFEKSLYEIFSNFFLSMGRGPINSTAYRQVYKIHYFTFLIYIKLYTMWRVWMLLSN